MKNITVLFLLTLTTIAFAQESKWSIDKTHSSIGFDIDHLVISQTEGTFKDYNAVITADTSDFSNANFEITIKAKSIDTENEKRDDHLRNADFFNVEKYPTIHFKTTEFKKIDDKNYALTGMFTMHGVTKEVTFDAIYGGVITHPSFGTRAGLRIMGSLKRYDFGLTYNSAMEAGGFILGEDVRIDCRLEMVKQ